MILNTKQGKPRLSSGSGKPKEFVADTLQSFDDIFGISHPVFLWIFRTTRNWESVSGLLPAMRAHLNQTVLKGSRPGTKSAELDLKDEDGEPIEDYSIIFRELFCIAAADLASQTNQTLESSGVLFDDILTTGTKPSSKGKNIRNKSTPSSSVDIERDGLELPMLGRGQLLFLVRRVNRRDAENLQAAGFRFANVQNVADIVARSMQINTEELVAKVHSMRAYASETHILEPGVHLGCFAIRASVRGGFDVLVRSDARNQLPTMQVPIEHLDNFQMEYLTTLDGTSVAMCLKHLKSRSINSALPRREQMFTLQMHDTLVALVDEINDPFFLEALLIAKPVAAPCRGLGEGTKPGEALLIAFRMIVPIHSRAPGQKLEFIPLSFFKMQQHVYQNSSDHAVFARKIHREFGPILNQVRPDGMSRSPMSANFPHRSKFAGAAGKSNSSLDVRTQLETSLPTLTPRTVEKRAHSSIKFWHRNNDKLKVDERPIRSVFSDTESEKNLVEQNAFGGIMVSQEVSVDIRDIGARTPGPGESGDEGTEMVKLHKKSTEGSADSAMKMGTLGIATKEVEDPETYVDKLFTVCVETR